MASETIIHCYYSIFPAILTGKRRETLKFKGDTVDDFLDKLDEKYPGIREIFLPPEAGLLNIRTLIRLRRPGEPTMSVNDKKKSLMDGDILTLI